MAWYAASEARDTALARRSAARRYSESSRYGFASLRRSRITPLLPFLAPENPSPRRFFPLLPSQAECATHTCGTSSPAGARRFPQPLWTTHGCVRLRSDGRRGVPEQPHGAGLPCAASRWRSAVAGGRGSRTNGRQGMPVCVAVGGPVSAAADTPAPLDCPRLALGCQATFRPPIGSATRSNGRCALPHLHAPQGAHTEGTGNRCALPVPSLPPAPTPPHGDCAEWSRRAAPCCIPAVGFRPALPTPDKHVSAHPAFQPTMFVRLTHNSLIPSDFVVGGNLYKQ